MAHYGRLPPIQKAEKTLGDVIQGKDAVTAVNEFCQRYKGGPINKDDITYETLKLPEGYQATIKLNAVGGVEFAGDLAPNARDAKLSAAAQVLVHFADDINQMTIAKKNKPKPNKGTKRTAEDAGMALPSSGAPGAPANASAKGDLNTTYSKILRRVIAKGEIIYVTNPVQGGRFQSQVQLPGLPTPWDKMVWAGEPNPKKADAEQSVAMIALEQIRGDPQLMAAFSAPPKENQWIKNGGLQRMREKGKGKGKDSNSFGGGPPMATSVAPQSSALAQAAHDSAVWNQTFAAALAASGLPPQYLNAAGGLAGGLGGATGFGVGV